MPQPLLKSTPPQYEPISTLGKLGDSKEVPVLDPLRGLGRHHGGKCWGRCCMSQTTKVYGFRVRAEKAIGDVANPIPGGPESKYSIIVYFPNMCTTGAKTKSEVLNKR